MSDYQELVNICKHLLFDRFAPAPSYIRGLLGDGQGNVLVPDRPDYNYARFNRSSTDVFEIFNKEVSQPVDNLPILIGEYPWQPGLTQVVGVDWAAYVQTGWGDTYANLQAHASTHEWPDLSPGSDYTRTFLRSIVPLQGYGAGSGTSYNFYAQPYEYDHTGTSQYWPGFPPISLAASLPATGTMRYMGVYLNPGTNQLGSVTGSTVAYVDNAEPPRPKFPLNVYPVAYARLYGGQQFIAERDTRDARRLWNNTLTFTGTSSGGGGGWPFTHVLTVSATDPSADYTTIQAAHDAGSAGDVIWPDPATYAESLALTKAIILYAPGVTVTGAVTISGAATMIYLTTTQTVANARGFVCSGGVTINLLDCKAVPNGSTTAWAIEVSGMDTTVNVRGGYYEELGAGTRVSVSVGADALVIMDDPIIVNPVFVETGFLRGQYLDQGGNVYVHGTQYFDNLSSMSGGVWLESSTTHLRTHYFVSGSPSAALLAAIAALADGGTIVCSPGSYSVEAVITANNATIEGIGEVTITSAVDDTITLQVNGNDVRFRNLIIQHTGAGGVGYPVAFDGNNFTLENCTLTKTGAASLGAGLYQYGGTGARAFNTFVTASGATTNRAYHNTGAAGGIEFWGGKLSGTQADIWSDVSTSTIATYGTVLEHNLVNYAGTYPRHNIQPLPVKPIMLNGHPLVWQRGTSFAAAANGSYSADRYKYGASGVMVHTLSRSTDVPTMAQAGVLLQYSLLADVTTIDASIGAGDHSEIMYTIEGYNFQRIAQQQFTIPLWIKATKTGIYCVAFRNSVADRSYVAEITVNTTATHEYKQITVPASPSAGTWNYANGAGLFVTLAYAVGSTFQTTANTWATGNFLGTSSQVNSCDSTANDTRVIFGDPIPGPYARPFEVQRIDELANYCQRYYQKSYDLATDPGAITAVGAESWNTRVAIAASTAGVLRPGKIKFAPRLRNNTPTMTAYAVDGTSGAVSNISGTTVRTGATITASIGETGFSRVEISNADADPITADQLISMQWTANDDF